MPDGVATITFASLALAFVPVVAVGAVLYAWNGGASVLVWATLRMFVQLLAVGYALTFLFAAEHPLMMGAVVAVMLLAASWIALRPLAARRPGRFPLALGAIAAACLTTLALIIFGVLQPQPWYQARVLIPIAGMVFSSAMNSVSLAAERFDIELGRGQPYLEARRDALGAAMIPLLNAFFAVGLVALPGMMTGQILSGVDPQIAVRYQIMVMAMTFGAAGLAAVGYLVLVRPDAVAGEDGAL